ncbi:MAG: LacI family DNA-binding transcriptional regulator [Verrucomicrobia bacterium]|nr:LacI family DNA-binding transcriptional regulator [Verrucomicrobiota bacterium]
MPNQPVRNCAKKMVARMRPGERVMRCLSAEFERPDLKEGSRLPSIREFAAQLNVSIFTVQQVFNKLAREGRIRTEVGNGTFLVSASRSGRNCLTIAVGIPTPGMAPELEWHYRMYGGMLAAAAQGSQPVTLHPLPQTEADTEAVSRRLLQERGQVDGLILFPNPHGEKVRAAYETEGRFVVDVNPPSETATANFVSPDYLGASRQLAEVWRRTGRRRILLLLTNERDSVSRRLRIAGVAGGLDAALGRAVSLQVIETGGDLEPRRYEASGHEAMRRALQEEAEPPDAIYCEGDFLAVGALRALREAGICVPSEVSVVAGSGLNVTETWCPQLTRTQHPLEQMGACLVVMLLERIQRQGADMSARVLPTPFIGGATTRSEENELLDVRQPAPWPRCLTTPTASAQPPSPL